MISIFADKCPVALSATIAPEFGTGAFLRISDTLRGDDIDRREGVRFGIHLGSAARKDEVSKWRGMVVGQARTGVVQALCGLGG
ncbi:hypothetical protein [Variovorax boronicumulans]|uniref:hypothetical protein n=1 Tax=Variovorax boronicumulans TaxID=436515 RepID=UPI001C57B5ED